MCVCVGDCGDSAQAAMTNKPNSNGSHFRVEGSKQEGKSTWNYIWIEIPYTADKECDILLVKSFFLFVLQICHRQQWFADSSHHLITLPTSRLMNLVRLSYRSIIASPYQTNITRCLRKLRSSCGKIKIGWNYEIAVNCASIH